MIHIVVQMVRVVGLTDGPGFSLGYGLGGRGFLDYGLLDKFIAKMLCCEL